MMDMTSSGSMHSKQMMQGWGVSSLLHLGLVFAAVTMMPSMTRVVDQEPFKWEVALVTTTHEVSAPTSKVEPPRPQPSQFVPPSEPPPEPEMVVPQQSRQVIHRPVQPVQEIVQEQPKPVERQEAKKEEIQEPEPVVKEVVREAAPVIEPVATAYPYETPTSVPSQPVIEHHSEPPATASAPPVAAAEPAPVSPSSAPAMGAPAASPADVPVAHEPPPVVASAPTPRAATKADYAWLADSLGRRIAALTRYPSSARLNGWEGRVVLRAIIRADGHLLEVTVHRSSGHDALDRAALETIKLACPLHMKHSLSTAEVAVYVPIVYSLSG